MLVLGGKIRVAHKLEQRLKGWFPDKQHQHYPETY